MFLSKSDITLNNGYLVAKGTEKIIPIDNFGFVNAQKSAYELDVLVQTLKEKDFVGRPADSFLSAVEEANVKAKEAFQTTYTVKIDKPVNKLSEQLKEEALNQMKYQTEIETAKKLNQQMQRYCTISQFEEIGLHFKEQVVKLPKIYTIEEIKSLMLEFLQLAPQ
jgi:hypothetical protein